MILNIVTGKHCNVYDLYNALLLFYKAEQLVCSKSSDAEQSQLKYEIFLVWVPHLKFLKYHSQPSIPLHIQPTTYVLSSFLYDFNI